jgi:sulfotransferase family protein
MNSTGPIFILAPPRSFTSVVGAMIGQHPQTYGLPELELFAAETMAEWWGLCAKATFPRVHGSLRAVAEIFFGEQTEETVKLARGWLRRRSHVTTGYFLELLADQVRPRILVEKSTSNVYRHKFMGRAYNMFPGARFIHLVRHPHGHGKSVMKFLAEREKQGSVPPDHWMHRLAAFSTPAPRDGINGDRDRHADPQRAWHALHTNICRFLQSVPPAQQLRVRGEDVLSDPDTKLGEIAGWLGLRTDEEAIEEMKHPERSPYACFGPRGARYGNDRFFLEDPVLRPARVELHSLDTSPSWRTDGPGFLPEVKRLAREFGYE